MKYITTILLVLCCSNAAMAAGSAELERKNLSKIITELDYLSKTVNRIQYEAGDQSRLKFDYKALNQDLHTIKSGINDYLTDTLNNGRVIRPLNGDYE